MGDKIRIDSMPHSEITKEQQEWAEGIIKQHSHLPLADRACAIARHIIGEKISEIARELENKQMVVMK